jgi:ABC-type amino acid transport system permease subunit
MNTKVDTGFQFVAQQLRSIASLMEAVRSGIEQVQHRRYLAAYACILVSMLDRTQLAREAGHSRGMVIAKPG